MRRGTGGPEEVGTPGGLVDVVAGLNRMVVSVKSEQGMDPDRCSFGGWNYDIAPPTAASSSWNKRASNRRRQRGLWWGG